MYTGGEKAGIWVGLCVLVVILVLMVYGGLSLEKAPTASPEVGVATPQAVDPEQARLARLNFIADLCSKGLPVEEINRQTDAYDAAHGAKPPSPDEIQAKERSDNHLRAEILRKQFGMEGDDKTLSDQYDHVIDRHK